MYFYMFWYSSSHTPLISIEPLQEVNPFCPHGVLQAKEEVAKAAIAECLKAYPLESASEKRQAAQAPKKTNS